MLFSHELNLIFIVLQMTNLCLSQMIPLLSIGYFTGLLVHVSSLALQHPFTANNSEYSDSENSTWKNIELRHRIKDSSYLLDDYPMGELSPHVSACRKPAKCIPLHKNSCMGTKLPYLTTTLDFLPESITQEIIEVKKIIHYSCIFCSNLL